MSSLDKLSIQGIRSFSPYKNQTIEFYKPLTFIVGPNGCGKTTTIECLKYATTGVLPPGSDQGKNFVHDPTIAGEDHVSGVVKLKFFDKTGDRPMKVTRVMKLRKKKTKLEFKTMDSTIELIDDQGRLKSLNHKVQDTNTMIPEFLACSKAVLDNVIFTHQEESNWPLGDKAELKRRFDQIFESTRYTKALDDLLKQKKANKKKADEARNNLNLINKDLEQYRKEKANLEKVQLRLDELLEGRAQLQSKLNAAEEECTQLNTVIREAGGIKQTVQNLRVRLESNQEEAKRVEDSIETLFTESLEELTAMAQRIADKEEHGKHQIDSLRDQKGRCEKDMTKVQVEKEKIITSLAKLNHEHAEATKFRKVHFENMSRICRKYTIGGSPASEEEVNAASSKRVLRSFHNIQMELKRKFESCTADVEKARKEFNSAESKLKLEEQSSSRQIADRQQRKEKITSQIQKERDKLASMGNNQSRMAARKAKNEKDIARSMASLQNQENGSEEDGAKAKVNDLDTEKHNLRSEIQVLRQECEEYERSSSLIANIERKKEIWDNEKAKLSALEKELLPDLRDLCDDTSADVTLLADRVQSIVKRKQTAQQESAEQLVNCKGDRRATEMTVNALIKSHGKDESALRKRRGDLENKILPIMRRHSQGDVGDITKGPETLSLLREKLAEVNSKHHMNDAMAKIAQMAITHSKQDHECLLCRRKFGDRGAVNDFIESMNSQMNQNANAGDAVSKAETLKKDIQSLEQHLSDYKNVWQKENARVEEQANTLEEARVNLETLSEKVVSIEKQNLNNVEALDEARKVLAVTEKYLSQAELCKVSAEKYEDLRFNLSGGVNFSDNKKNLESIRKDKTEKENELDDLEAKIANERRKLEKLQEERRTAEKAHQALLEERHRIEKDMHASKEIEDKIARMIAEKKSIDNEIDSLRNSLKPERERLEQQITTKTSVLKGSERALEEAKSEFSKCEKDLNGFETSHQNLAKFQSRDLEAQVDSEKERLGQREQQLLGLKQQFENLSQQIEHLMSQSDGSKMNNFKNNIRLRQIEEEIKDLSASIAAKESRLEKLDARRCQQRYGELDSEMYKLNTQLANEQGTETVLQKQKEDLELILRDQKYRKIEDRHSEIVIEHQTLLMTVSDLDKYYKALDSALHQYHSTKIAEINSIIKELWQLTYRGGDIDTIEIRSDANEKKGGRGGRSYNYRVVMKKGASSGTKALDMRGHCSAGQKVLACLIVRLALAETFSGDCGIFCLDEPTTNLDEANKKGFAEALQQILEARAKQSNFQLVVITHDEEFMENLSSQQSLGGGLPRHFFKINREEDQNNPGQYYSVAKRHSYV
jgi:DNA repair protein RAD50